MYSKILEFWFEEIHPKQWWIKDEEFDRLIFKRFEEIHAKAIRCELFKWRVNAEGRLAEIIVLDQFSRNMFRGLPLSFTHDQMALVLAQEAVSLGLDMQLEPEKRGFLYMPYMHSESPKIHEVAENLYRRHGVKSSLEWELKHKRIVERFGRYPHRNAILGRKSTTEELDFLQQPGSGF